MRWEIDADALRRDAERLRADAVRALVIPRVIIAPTDRALAVVEEAVKRARSIDERARIKVEGEAAGCQISYYDEDTAAFKAAYRNAKRDDITTTTDGSRRVAYGGRVTPICGAMTCRCGKGKHGDCAYWRARDAREGPADTWTEPEMIAQQLWRESCELLAKVGVELPSSPPPPVKPMRWYRHPLVKRFGWFGAAPALAFLLTFYGLAGQLPFGGSIVAFLWGAFITYEMTARTDARGIEIRTKVKPRHLAARIMAIVVIAMLIGWVT